MLLKIDWDIQDMLPEKAGVPVYWKVPLELRTFSLTQLKNYLKIKYCYNIKKIEVIY